MEVILLERVAKLGQMGETVKVRPGYARNFLLARGKALRATKENKERFETQRAQLEARNLERRTEAQGVADKLNGQSFTVIRQAGETGVLYGSVSTRDIAEIISKGGFSVSREQINLNLPIKTLGLHAVPVALHPEVEVQVTVNVARSPEEAELQAQGVDVMADMFEKDTAGFTEERDPNAEPGEIPADTAENTGGEGEAASA